MVNRAAASMFGYQPEELLGTRMHQLVHAKRADGSFYPFEECPVAQVIQSGTTAVITDDVYWKKDGTRFPVEYSAAPIVDRDEIVGAVVTFTDTTERKKLESRLEQANRISSLGRLAAIVAHEFNNVLMGVAPFVEVIRRNPSPQKVTAALDHIANSVKRGRRITEDILRFTQPAEPNRTRVDLVAWLQATVIELRTLLPATIEIDLAAGELPPVDVDAGQLQQVLVNLAVNARDAMPSGGRIVVAARRDEAGTLYPFGPVREPERFVHLALTDTGAGMSDETVRHVFEPLFTTKRNGTGLGLAVAHQVMQRHGGEIFAESTIGKGTTFHLFLPISGEVRELPRQEAPPPEPERRRRRLLLVEDDVSVAAGLRTLLEFEGYEVQGAETGAAALEAIRSDPPDVVVLDIGLPDMDGRNVYDALARLAPDVAVVFSTGHGDQTKIKGLDRPDVRFLQKPYAADTLLKALDDVLAARLSLSPPPSPPRR
jgi:PAS domain S-box-containing protein